MPNAVDVTPFVEIIFQQTKSDILFERFCVAHFSELEGNRYVATSPNYDNNRDGRTELSSRVRGTSYICASTIVAGKVRTKAREDFIGLLKHDGKPGKVRFCFTAPITELERDKIIQELQPLAPNVPLEVSGFTQLSNSVTESSTAFQRVYSAELDAYERLIYSRRRPKEVTAGMRSALSIVLTSDAHALRVSILDGMILHRLVTFGSSDELELCGAVAQQLGLLNPVNRDYLIEAVQAAENRNWLRRAGEKFEITPEGRAEYESRQGTAAKSVIEGITHFRSIVERSGHLQPNESEFKLIWRCVEDGIANLFLENGQRLAAEVAQFAFGASATSETTTLQTLATGVQTIAKSILKLAKVRSVVTAGVAELLRDIILDTESPCFAWMSHLCILYLASAALSLDPSVQDAISKRVAAWDLFLDTHLLLSLLGDGEPDHIAVKAVIDGWTRCGGVITVAKMIVDEVAHHAEIASQKYREWSQRNRRRLRRSSGATDSPPASNVFLRAFIARTTGKGTAREWSTYIANFQSPIPQIQAPLISALKEDFHLHVDEKPEFDPILLNALLKEARRQAHSTAGELSSEDRRIHCDVNLIAHLAHHRSISSSRYSAIVSRSTRLRQICEAHRELFGLQSAVIPLSRLAFALALLPQASMNLQSLRTILFDLDFSARVSPEYSRATRLLKLQAELSPSRLAGEAQLGRMVDSAISSSV